MTHANASPPTADADPTVSEHPPERVLLDDRAIRRALMRIAHEIVERTEEPERLSLVAIPTQPTDKVIFRRAGEAPGGEGTTGEEELGGDSAAFEIVVRGGAGT